MTAGLVPTIGLEVHVQLATRTKLFSPAPHEKGAPPNTRVHAVDLGLPGTLPVCNERAVALAVRAALALSGHVQRVSHFARKHYFYPDLPKGYQITQYELPYCLGGTVPFDDARECRLQRIHLEEDAGKLVHVDAGTLVDLDRAGTPLIEIVTLPELHDPHDAHAFLVSLREILRFAGVSECDMELGSLRCDANVSLAAPGAPLGTKVEIKNLNSFKMVQRALEYEIRRQRAILSIGGEVAQETRLWNEERAETRPMRQKEFAEDYRYFPDPDLPPLVVDELLLSAERSAVGEPPRARRRRYGEVYALSRTDVDGLTQDRATGDWFEAVLTHGVEPKTAANWVLGDVLKLARDRDTSIEDLPVTPRGLAELLALVQQGALTATTAKQAFAHMAHSASSAASAVQALGLSRITDEAVLLPLVAAACAALPEAVADCRAGRTKALDALKGHVMRACRGKADPQVLDAMLQRALATP